VVLLAEDQQGIEAGVPERLPRRRDAPGELVAGEMQGHGIVLSSKRIAAGWQPSTPGATVPLFATGSNGFPS
jgi:hypothetical protein